MRSRRFAALALSLPALALSLALPVTALAADKIGAEGTPHTIHVNGTSSDSYLAFHGRMFVTSGKTTTEYRWGGTACGSRTMTPENVQLLLEVVRDGNLTIVPAYQNGQGTSRCLVAFTIKAKSTPKPKPKPR
jgi:hypothetical protein